MSDNINEALENKAEEAAEAVETAAEEAAEAAETAAEEAAEPVEAAAEEAAEAAETAAEEAAEPVEAAAEEAAEAAGAVTEEAAAEVAAEPAEAAPAPEKQAETAQAPAVTEDKPKKKSKAGKVILIIFIVLLAVLLLLAGAAFFAVRAATKDTLPKAPAVSASDMNEFAMTAAGEVLTENTITIDSSQFNAVLDQAKKSVSGSVEGVDVEDLFCELKDGKGTIYGRIHIDELPMNGGRKIKLDKTFPVQLDFDVDFADPEIMFIPEKLTCGTIDIPMSTVSSALDSAQLPENMRAENGVIYYDTSVLDGMIDQILADRLAQQMQENELLGALGSLLGEDTVTNIVSEATDVQIFDADIVDDKLVISAQIM